MSQGLSHYYSKAKGGLMGINPREATQLGEDWLIAGGTGLVLGLVSASIGGLDKTVAGMSVPVDGMAAFGFAIAGLAAGSPELKTASIAAGGSAATRTFEKFFKKSFKANGDFEGEADYGYGAEPAQLQDQYGYGYGHEDRLVAAAANL